MKQNENVYCGSHLCSITCVSLVINYKAMYCYKLNGLKCTSIPKSIQTLNIQPSLYQF